MQNSLQKSWSGRLSLQVKSEPPQAFSAGFELKGDAGSGELILNSPLGNTLGALRWSPSEASLRSGNEIKNYGSVEELMLATTGAAVPVAALFDWLEGNNTQLNGWSADLSRHPEGRISALRSSPLPEAELRVVLDRP